MRRRGVPVSDRIKPDLGADNPPIGLLLCTQKDHALVEYAVAAIDSRLFVSRYQLELPSKEDLQRFLEDKRRAMGDHG